MVTEPHDDPFIGADDRVIRRIDGAEHIVHDKNTGESRVSSKAYKASSGPHGGMSVDIEALILESGLNPKHFVTNPKFTGSVYFHARDVRALGLWVGKDPIAPSATNPGNPYHGEVWRVEQVAAVFETRRFTGSQQNSLMKLAAWYVEIPGVSLGTGGQA